MKRSHQIHEWLERVVQRLVADYRAKIREQEPNATIVYSVNIRTGVEWEVIFLSSGISGIGIHCLVQSDNLKNVRVLASPTVEAMPMEEAGKVIAKTRLFLDLLEELNQACANYEIPKA
jgi:hypothetical protein